MNLATQQIIDFWQNPEFQKKFVFLDDANLNRCANELAE